MVKGAILSRVGIPTDDFKTVGQIVGTNTIRLHGAQNGMAITIERLSAHVSGGPVLDEQRRYVGFISEFDILKAFEARKDLTSLTAAELMIRDPIAVHKSTPIPDAIKLMADKHVLKLPVEEDGAATYSVTTHDLLRASIGLVVGIEE